MPLKPYKFGAGAGKRRAVGAVKNAYYNVASKPASRYFGMDTPEQGKKFGQTRVTAHAADKRITGLMYGAVGGSVGSMLTPRGIDANRKQNLIQRNQKQIANQNRKIKQHDRVHKSRYNLITDVGTNAGRRYPQAKGILLHTGVGAGAGALSGMVSNNIKHNLADKKLAQQRKKIAQNKLKMQERGIAKSAFFEKSVMAPNSQPQGQRKAPKTKKGKYKARPKPGKGQYVKAPLMRDKLTSHRWMANAAVNHPGNVAAGGALGAAAALHQAKRNFSPENKKRADVAEGALVGGSVGHIARQGADYGAKATAEHQFKPVTNKGNYGPYKDGPHKPVMNKYKREAHKNGGSDVRSKAKYFDEHFPKGVPSYRARKLGVALNKKPALAGAVIGGAAIGAGAAKVKDKLHKSGTVSAFGVEHG